MQRITIILVAIVALVVIGCAQTAQKAIEQTTGIKVDQKGESITIQGKDGEKISIGSQVPDELKGFPVPQGFTPDSSGSMAAGGDKLAVASWKGKGTILSLADFYKKAMSDQGWKEEFAFSDSKSAQWIYSKGDSGATVTVAAEGDGLTISVILGKSSQKPGGTGLTGSIGGNLPAKPTAAATAAASKPTSGLADKPAPAASPTPSGPSLTSATAVPAELKDFPVPNGFAVVKDSVVRLTKGGNLQTASAKWFGKASLREVGDFLQRSLPSKGWREENFVSAEDDIFGNYINTKDASLLLVIEVSKTDAGIEITAVVNSDK